MVMTSFYDSTTAHGHCCCLPTQQYTINILVFQFIDLFIESSTCLLTVAIVLRRCSSLTQIISSFERTGRRIHTRDGGKLSAILPRQCST